MPCQRLELNIRNNSKSPSRDPNREKFLRNNSSNKTSGQKGHNDLTLALDSSPNITHKLSVGMTFLPKGHYKDFRYKTCQVVDTGFNHVVTEFQTQILKMNVENILQAYFLMTLMVAIQYSKGVKAHTVYLSQYQLLPYEHIQKYFSDKLDTPLSSGSLYNFISTAYSKLEALLMNLK